MILEKVFEDLQKQDIRQGESCERSEEPDDGGMETSMGFIRRGFSANIKCFF